ncbi:hypothetical protein AVM03_00085 [Bacillus amyloliquefaciens]|nr:hypothetical protein AVM03_00085 [Bacillus amyloliquefaciens]
MQPVYYIMPPSVFFLFNPIPQKTPNGGKLVFLVTCPSFRTPVCSDKAQTKRRPAESCLVQFKTVIRKTSGLKNTQKSLKMIF